MRRKRFRSKRRACRCCKPDKRGYVHRWDHRQMAQLEQWEREQKGWLGRRSREP